MFTSEKDLVKAFHTSAKDFLGTVLGKTIPDYFLMEEFDSRHGVADLVLGLFNSSDGFGQRRKAINWDWVQPLLNFEEESGADIARFMEVYGVSRRTAQMRLCEYAEAGFIAAVDDDHYRLVRKYQPVTDTIIAIEAKLKNWQQALNQACRYKRFSHQSYVLLDSHNVRPALRKIDSFIDWNIGLISLGASGYTIHHQPVQKEVGRTHSYWRLNEAVFDRCAFRWANA